MNHRPIWFLGQISEELCNKAIGEFKLVPAKAASMGENGAFSNNSHRNTTVSFISAEHWLTADMRNFGEHASKECKWDFEINGNDLLLIDLNVFCNTNANNRAILEQLKQLFITNNTTGASIYDLGKVVQSDSIAELNNALKDSEQKQQQMKQQEQQSAQQMQEQQLQAKAQEEQLKRDYEMQEAEKNRQRDILVAEIRAAGMGAMVDLDQNMMSDYRDSMKDIQETEQYQEQTSLQRDKETNRMSIETQKAQIERERIQAQRDIANTQFQIAQENKNKYDAKSNRQK